MSRRKEWVILLIKMKCDTPLTFILKYCDTTVYIYDKLILNCVLKWEMREIKNIFLFLLSQKNVSCCFLEKNSFLLLNLWYISYFEFIGAMMLFTFHVRFYSMAFTNLFALPPCSRINLIILFLQFSYAKNKKAQILSLGLFLNKLN